MPLPAVPNIQPFKLAFAGLDAERQTADAVFLGQSIYGTARFYNSVVNWHLTGQLLSPARQDVRTHIGPVGGGSLLYMIYLFMVHGTLPMYPELLCELLEIAFPKIVKAIIEHRSGQSKSFDSTIDALKGMYDKYDKFATQVHADHVREKSQLIGMIGQLAHANDASLRDMVVPIGKTVRQIDHFAGTKATVIIDEPTADAITSKVPAEVGESKSYSAKLVAVDTTTGACKLILQGETEPIRAKITDPVVQSPPNIYTTALDNAETVIVTAKPVSKAGQLSTLYVSDAKSGADTLEEGK